ncbi:MAG: hypothetical protein Q9208_004878 [Pyrenodesmia sp. 3 TL-2023]
MAGLRANIQDLRCRNVENQHFVPNGVLSQVMTAEVVAASIRDCYMTPREREEAVELIMSGGQRLFAILTIEHIQAVVKKFVEAEPLLHRELDSSLPFSAPTLRDILPAMEAQDFYERQWEFAAPILGNRKGHRVLHEKTIFPFLKSTERVEGGFAFVFEVEIHPEHGQFNGPAKRTKFIRKELKQRSSENSIDFRREIDILSFLNSLNHPNIVELLGSYTCKGIHNLLFLPASGDLSDLLDDGNTPGAPDTEAGFAAALYGLSSALEKLHNFALGSLDDIEYIGCHRDLKPKNVLVEKGTFLLADFGLSSLKKTSEDSKSPFKGGPGWYMAPECEDADDEFRPGLVGRAGDIWSFGCIISEVATYMRHGSKGVAAFRARRKLKLGPIQTKTFHQGSIPHAGVEAWLNELKKSASSTVLNLIKLARTMLQIKPALRPVAKSVKLSLRHIALGSTFLEAQRAYERSLRKDEPLELSVEKERLSLWGEALGLTSFVTDEEQQNLWTTEVDTIFDSNFRALSQIADELNSYDPDLGRLALSLRLRLLNDELANTLPLSLQKSIISKLELCMVDTNDLGLLQKIKTTFDETSANRSIGTLAAIKYMHELCNRPSENPFGALRLQGKPLRNPRRFKAYELATFVHNGQKSQILVEHVVYSESWMDRVGKELFHRVGAIVQLLQTASRTSNFNVLRCIGYTHEQESHSFALLFELPDHTHDSRDPTNPRSLEQLMGSTQESGFQRPRLDERLKLALNLATAVSAIHKANWLHKRISSSRILFFLHEPLALNESLPTPYLIGFNHSRPDDIGAFSVKPDTDELYYQHPEYSYLSSQGRYRPEYDYFSLGMILLEIGLWKTLESMLQSRQPGDILNIVRKEWVPLLGFHVGQIYQDVVEACLNGDFGMSGQDSPSRSHTRVHASYETKVVEQLQSCHI